MHSPLAPVRLSAAVLSLLFVPGLAHAHITLTDPPARHPATDLKEGPCGIGSDDARTTDPEKISTYTAGETIDINFTETIQHVSHYRIMISSTGDAAFVDPTGYEDTSLSPGDLADGIEDLLPGGFPEEEEITIPVTLPNEPCEACTIQLIQVMHDKPPWGPEPTPNGADIYYQCADIVILPGSDTGSGGAGSGGAGSGGDTGLGSGGAPTGTGGGPAGSGGSPAGSGGSSLGSGGVATGSGGVVGAGGSLVGSGGGETVPPAMPSSCSYPAGSPRSSGAGWLALSGLAWLALRRRRTLARRA